MTKQHIPKIRFQGFDGDWKIDILENLSSFAKGNGYTKNDLTDNGQEIILYGQLYTDYKTQISYSNYFVSKINKNTILSVGGEVVVPASGESADDISRASVISNPNIIIGGDLNIIYPNNKILASVFLVLTISNGSQQKELKRRAQGKSVVHLRNSDLKQVKIPLPSLPEQESIGQLFRTLDDLISAYKKNLEHYQSLKTSILSKMFPKEGQKQPEIRLDGFEGDWEEKKFSDILKVNSGRDYKHLELGDIPVYGTGGYMLSVNKSLSDSDAIGIGRKGTIDKPFILKSPFWTVDTLFYVTSDYVKLNFLYSVFQSINWKKFDESTGVPSLSKKTIEKIYKLFPSIPEQEAIGAFFANLDETISSYQDKIGQLELLKKNLLSQMFI